MNVRELGQALLNFPNQNAIVVLKDSGDWLEVQGVKPTGRHRNAVTLELTIDPGTGSPGVIVYHEDAGPAPEEGVIRVAIIANVEPGTFPEGHFWAAEFETFQATGPTPEAAVEALRGAMRAEGREAPTRVYDVAKTISGWMN